MKEKWRWIHGHEARYAVSSLGRVRSHVGKKPRVLRPAINPRGYQQVSLSNGDKRSHWVHRLVALAFVSKAHPDFDEVNHIDCNPSNNDCQNLEWTTHKENIAHSVSLGRYKPPPIHRGEGQWNARFSEADVREIRAESEWGLSYDVIAESRGCTKYAIYAIVKRKSWAHVA